MTDEWRKDCELWLNYGLQKRGCVKMSTSSFFMHKAPTFSSQGFAIS